MDSKRNEVWAVRQTWKKSFYHSHSQMQRGLQERRRSSPFSITLFCISTVKTCFCLHECKERWSNQLCPQSLPGISISPGWDDSAMRTDPGKSSMPVWDGKESSFQQSDLQDLQREQIWTSLVKPAGLTFMDSWSPINTSTRQGDMKRRQGVFSGRGKEEHVYSTLSFPNDKLAGWVTRIKPEEPLLARTQTWVREV